MGFVESTAFSACAFCHNAAATYFFGDFAAAVPLTALIKPTSASSVLKAKVCRIGKRRKIPCPITLPFTLCDENSEGIAE